MLSKDVLKEIEEVVGPEDLLEEPEDRVRDFREVEKGFGPDEAQKESKRCLRCDLEER